jgi:3-demethoxyubiquinol 3-hydroxylase
MKPMHRPSLRPAVTKAEKMIKVDHAGENGAVNIYRAQYLVCRIFRPSLCAELLDFQRHEEAHRAIFLTWLQRRGIRRCVSYHGCGFGGFVLGLVTALLGRRAIWATTYAVEHVVLDHLDGQLAYLRSRDDGAYRCVEKIYAEEKAHHDHGHHQISRRGVLTRTLIACVQLSTETVIRIGMR